VLRGVISKCFERPSKALAVFLSAVFCEMIVTISVLGGFFVGGIHLDMVYVFRRVAKIL
jgi:hypothetical protein